MRRRVAAVVLAAGEGTRMRSRTPKVLHRLNGIPMIDYVLNAVGVLRPERTVVVVSRDNSRSIREHLRAETLRFALQNRPLGTANALYSVRKALKGFDGDLLVLCGDTPLITPETLSLFSVKHRRAGNLLSILSFTATDPTGYGRIIRDSRGRACMIREERDAGRDELNIKEVNSGIYLLSSELLPMLRSIRRNVNKGEYYLTDLLDVVCRRGLRASVYRGGDEKEFAGINTKGELLAAQAIIRERTVRSWVEREVEFMDEKRVYIAPDVVIGPGTFVYPDVYLEGRTIIGSGCTIYPNVRIRDCKIGDHVEVRDSSVLEASEIADDVIIGPFARLRPGSRLSQSVRIGNFVEIKNSSIGEGTKAQHLSYIGDAEVGRDVNIGAGTITCNYDGIRKHKTSVGNGVFVGSDSQLVAPVTVNDGAYIGAGSTITGDVPSGALAVSRCEQRNVKGWVKRKMRKNKKLKTKT